MTTVLGRGRFFGSIEGRFGTGPLQLVETSYGSDQRIPEHRHNRDYFCLVLRGRYVERSADREVACRPAMVVFHPRGAAHEDHFGRSGGACFNLECDTSWLTDCGTGLETSNDSMYMADPYPGLLVQRLRREAASDSRYSCLAIDGLARALVAYVAERSAAAKGTKELAGAPSWLLEAVALARREYAAGPGLTEVARRVGVHPRHLSRTFRDQLGCTLGEFIRRKRVEAARLLLLESQDSISSVAYRTGFADQSHLTRTFHAEVGTTPAEYRQVVGRPSRSSPSR